ncbi:MAG TPA: MFS transporter [Chitinophagaceae bacterium]|nr:MFS transporter [Chitinophagaceae bacterium]
MGLRKSILSFLLVRESESKLVSRLFIFEFFQGAAIAIVFTTAITLFLQQLPINDLPKVFILSAFLLWLSAYIYNKLEHRFSGIKMVLVVLLFNMACVLFFLVLIRQDTKPWFLFAFLASFNILYLLNNLEFWGLASLLFDVRQSKRLFSVVSASDLPAKLFGYLLTLVLVPRIGSENLLWIALGCMLVSLLLYPRVAKLKEIRSLEHAAHQPHATHSLKSIQAALTGNRLIAVLAVVSFFSLCCLLVVNVILYGYIKHEFQSDKQMQGFFAIFLGTVRFITLFIKVGVTNRLVDRFGLKRSLLITPVILVILCLTTVYFSMQPGYYKAAFYLFGVMALATDVLCAAVQLPVILAAMQPLPTHQRLRGHTLLKGFMDPFAFLVMGALLWLVTTLEREPVPAIFGLILLALIICWIIAASRVNIFYSRALATAIRDKTLDGKFFSITDKESSDFLLEKLRGASQEDAFGILNMVATQQLDIAPFLETGLDHASPLVRLRSLQLIRDKQVAGLVPKLRQLSSWPDYAELLPEILDTITYFNPSEDLSRFLDHPDLAVTRRAVVSRLLHPGPESEKAAEKLAGWFRSGRKDTILAALDTAGRTHSKTYLEEISKALHAEDPQVQAAAIDAAGRHGDPQLVSALLDRYIHSGRKDPGVQQALLQAGTTSFHAIRQYLLDTKCRGPVARRLIALLGAFPGEIACPILEECVEKFPDRAKAILPVLVQHEHDPSGKQDLYRGLLQTDLAASVNLVYFIHFLDKEYPGMNLLTEALRLELADIRTNCLNLFTLLFDRDKLRRVKTGFELDTKDSVANALELLQVAVPREYATIFIAVFEKASAEDRIHQLRRIAKEPLVSEPTIIKNVMFDMDYTYNHWTKSCVLYLLRKRPLPFDKEFLRPYTHTDNRVLKQLAEIVISEDGLALT